MKKVYQILGKGAKIAAIIAIILKTLDFIRQELEVVEPSLKNSNEAGV
jgi:hypothetical protein